MQMEKTISKAVILGASGGIGRQLTRELATRTDQLVLVGRDEVELTQLQEDLSEVRAKLSYRVLDLLDATDVEDFAQQLEADLVINCCGLANFGPALSLSEADEKALWQVNYQAAVRLMRQIVERNRKIRLVQLSSLAALYPHPYLAAYSSSKAALQTYSLALQEELRLKGSEMTVCLYILGPVRTSIFPPELQDALGGAKLQMSPEIAARRIIGLLQQGRSYAIVGKRYRLLAWLMKLLPQRWIIRLIGAYLRKGL
ncbi:SDR family NAD(P)-dependent oxidoreductase [Streptococcus sanguinis]|jgi:ketoacyl reductase hetN, putative|uniref:Integrating conjugative element protein n=1 Tax=Streptococcus sanguinis SK1056 TaxID=888820 RepID=F3UAK8_STRSA|nr:SDR family NAD(P)-dependent oxidoreductase [Streptococcus sanguinis]EGJ38879.1 integrating conjugative element protein [Streptococcus sanguinis SK1056]